MIPDILEQTLASRHPILALECTDEGRATGYVQEAAEKQYQPLHTWSCSLGLDTEGGESRDPLNVLQAIRNSAEEGWWLMQDLSAHFGRPEVRRALRECYPALLQRPNSRLLLLSPSLELPGDLKPDVQALRLPPPSVDELQTLLDEVLPNYSSKSLPESWTKDILFALRGLELNHSRHLLHQLFQGGKLSRQRLQLEIGQAKQQLAGEGSPLIYTPALDNLEAVGGLDQLKAWIEQRTHVFTEASMTAGLSLPKGILLMGISGCGKSLSAKAIATAWHLPLFRLDMNQVFSSTQGNPEASFQQALKHAEHLAPLVLWIDEIENGLGLTEQDRQVNARILASFLTWMQEKPPLIFVVATANRIEALPAELIRKGRFDQLFFCDLPNPRDRAEILRIIIQRNQGDPNEFDLENLSAETRDWNAAELEQAVIGARIAAGYEDRPFNQDDLIVQTRQIVPLAQTMSEQIKFIRDWAWDRATPASKGEDLDLGVS